MFFSNFFYRPANLSSSDFLQRHVEPWYHSLVYFELITFKYQNVYFAVYFTSWSQCLAQSGRGVDLNPAVPRLSHPAYFCIKETSLCETYLLIFVSQFSVILTLRKYCFKNDLDIYYISCQQECTWGNVKSNNVGMARGVFLVFFRFYMTSFLYARRKLDRINEWNTNVLVTFSLNNWVLICLSAELDFFSFLQHNC